MGTKKVNYNKKGIDQLPNNKPVLYKIETDAGNQNYVGIAKRGRVRERIGEHLGNLPGSTVRIEQFNNVTDARKKEANIISRNKPKYNKHGK
jgi:hypothetical protein